MQKYLDLGTEEEKILSSICDAALKSGGMAVFGLVNQLVASIKTRDDE